MSTSNTAVTMYIFAFDFIDVSLKPDVDKYEPAESEPLAVVLYS